MVHAQVVQHAIEPGAELRLRLPARGTLPDTQERRLHQVLGLVARTQHALGKAERPAEVALDEACKGAAVAPRHRRHQLVVERVVFRWGSWRHSRCLFNAAVANFLRFSPVAKENSDCCVE